MASHASELARILVKETKPGKSLEVSLSGADSFCSFIEDSSRASVVGFFRELSRQIEQEHLLQDFHMKITDSLTTGRSFKVQIFFGEDDREGPEVVAPGECISCHAHADLYPGKLPKITAGDCIMSEIDGGGYVQCSIDAKARPGFIITPLRHVERMSCLEDDELYALWSAAVKALRSEGLSTFRSMILNHGSYRNLPHLHLKVWADPTSHHKVREAWTLERQELWRRLESMASMSTKRTCKFFLSKQGCRRGRQCTFPHQ